MKRPHASDDVRERALAAVDEGHPVADVAEFFQNDPSTIRRWIRQRQRTGSGLSRPRPGRARRLDAAHDELLPEQVATHPNATLAMRCERWNQVHQQVVSRSTMRRAIQRLGITLKKKSLIAREQDEQARSIWRQVMDQIDPQTLVFLR